MLKQCYYIYEFPFLSLVVETVNTNFASFVKAIGKVTVQRPEAIISVIDTMTPFPKEAFRWRKRSQISKSLYEFS